MLRCPADDSRRTHAHPRIRRAWQPQTVALPGGPTIAHLVDGHGRLIGRKVNGTLTQGFLWGDQLRIAAWTDGSGNVVSRFVYSPRVNVSEYMVNGADTYRLVTDHLGSVRLVVKVSDGSVAQRIDYDEFGVVTNDTNPGFQLFAFAGGLYDPDTEAGQVRGKRLRRRDGQVDGEGSESVRRRSKQPLRIRRGRSCQHHGRRGPQERFFQPRERPLATSTPNSQGFRVGTLLACIARRDGTVRELSCRRQP